MTRGEAREFRLEVRKAGEAPERLGRTKGQVMDWLLRFCQKDFGRLSEGDLNNLTFEVQCFTEFCGRHADVELPEVHCAMRTWQGKPLSSKRALVEVQHAPTLRHMINVYHDGFALQPSLPSVEQLRTLQREIHERIINLIDRKGIIFETPQVVLYIGPYQQSDFTKTVKLVDSPHDLFLYNFALFLERFAHRLKRCPECSTIFLAERRQKRYCSSLCQSRVATRRFRKTPPDRVGKRGRPPGTNRKNKMATSKERTTAKGGSDDKKKSRTR